MHNNTSERLMLHAELCLEEVSEVSLLNLDTPLMPMLAADLRGAPFCISMSVSCSHTHMMISISMGGVTVNFKGGSKELARLGHFYFFNELK